MKIFDVYEHPTKGIDPVKSGFCFPAAIFGVFWAVYAKQWLVAALIFGFMLIAPILYLTMTFSIDDPDLLSEALYWLDLLTGYITTLVVAFVVGSNANEWRAKNLRNKGFTLTTVVHANTRQEAISAVLLKRA